MMPNALFLLHTCDCVGGDLVAPGLYMQPATDDTVIEDAIDAGEADPEDFRLFCGYTGWGATQLEGELDQNAWFTARCGGSEPLVRTLLDLADGPSYERLSDGQPEAIQPVPRERRPGGWGLSEESVELVDDSSGVDVLEQAMRRWVSALSALEGEYRSMGIHFQSMPSDMDAEDIEELHRRAVA